MSIRSVTSMRMPQLGGMSQHWRISTLTLQLRPARLLAAGVPDAHAIPVELELQEAVPAGAGLPGAHPV